MMCKAKARCPRGQKLKRLVRAKKTMQEDVTQDKPQEDAGINADHNADIDIIIAQDPLAPETSRAPGGGQVFPLAEASIPAATGALPAGKRRYRPQERDGKRAKWERALVDLHPGTTDTPGARGSRDTTWSTSDRVPIIVLDDDDPPLPETFPHDEFSDDLCEFEGGNLWLATTGVHKRPPPGDAVEEMQQKRQRKVQRADDEVIEPAAWPQACTSVQSAPEARPPRPRPLCEVLEVLTGPRRFK
jgi:hypothetical protein